MIYKQHPLSAAFPAMSADEYQSLKDSIETSGVLNPITIYQGMVIDGWHRYTAADDLGVHCPEEELEEWLDPADFVLAQNKNRRHITVGQLALAVASVRKWKPQGGQIKGAAAAPSIPEEAENLGISVRSLKAGIKVEKEATPAVKQAVREKKISLERAEAISNLPRREQAAAIDKPAAKKEKFTQPAADTSADALNEAALAIGSLSEEVEVLKAELAVKHMEGSGEEKSQAAALITDLRSEIKTLNAELDAMRTSRDGLQRENRELMKQCGIYQRQLKQAQKA